MARPKSSDAVFPTMPDSMTDAEIVEVCRGCTNVGIMRGLIRAEIAYIRAGNRRGTRSIRGFWYTVIKSALSRAGVLNEKTNNGKDIEWDKTLSDELEDIVSSHEISYEELSIEDGSRQRFSATPMTHNIVDIIWVGPHYPWIILFIEKDTHWNIVRSVAQMYGVSIVSGSGFSAASCTENLLKDIARSDKFYDHYQGKLYLIGVTDHDPSGYEIFDTQRDQIKRHAPRELRPSTLSVLRIGVTPAQIPPSELGVKTYQLKVSKNTVKQVMRWVKATGGVNGKPLGIELDALSASSIRLLYASAIEKCISLEPRREDLRTAFLEELAWETLMPEFEERKTKLIDTVRASEVGKKIQQAELPPDLFSKAAIAGKSVIDPREVFEDYTDEVRTLMEKES